SRPEELEVSISSPLRPPRADILADIAGGPRSAISGCEQMQQTNALFDHLVGSRKYRRRHIEAERLGSPEIDNELELGRLLDRDAACLRPAQDLVDQVTGPPKQVRQIGPVGDQAACLDLLARAVNRWQSRAQRQAVEPDPVAGEERIRLNVDCICAAV